MVIRTEIDIEKMRDCILDSIEFAAGEDSYNAKVPIPLLYDVIDVLEETLRREQKHQTLLESALNFKDMEDGTQTNEMEEYNGCKKPDCYSEITGCYEVRERCSYNKTCVFRVKQKEMQK